MMISRRKFLVRLFVTFGGVSLAACGKKMGLAPTNTAVPTATSTITKTPTAAPTKTQTPTNTPEPTATPEPTEIPKVKLTKDFENPVYVPWEDLLNNRIESAEKVTFSKDAQFPLVYRDDGTQKFPQVTHMDYCDQYFFDGGKVDLDGPDVRPVRIVGYGRTVEPETGRELRIVLEAVHNRDGSVGSWPFILDVSVYEKEKKGLTTEYFHMVPAVLLKPLLYHEIAGSRELHKIAHQTAPNLLEDMQEFAETGIWTPDMTHPMAGAFMDWS